MFMWVCLGLPQWSKGLLNFTKWTCITLIETLFWIIKYQYKAIQGLLLNILNTSCSFNDGVLYTAGAVLNPHFKYQRCKQVELSSKLRIPWSQICKIMPEWVRFVIVSCCSPWVKLYGGRSAENLKPFSFLSQCCAAWAVWLSLILRGADSIRKWPFDLMKVWHRLLLIWN